MNGKVVKYLSVAAVVLALLAGAFAATKGDANSGDINDSIATVTVVSELTGFRVERNQELIEGPLDENDKESGQLWRFVQPEGSDVEFRITARYEQGASLKKLTNVTKQSLRDAVLGNVDLQLPVQYPDYEEVSRLNTVINGIEASEIVFTYNSNEQHIKQRLVLLFKNSDTVVYMQAQALESDFEELNQRYFESLIVSAYFE